MKSTRFPDLRPENWRKVLVRAPNWLGDVIMATPAFARIRSWAIGAELVCGLRPGHRPILGGSKSFDRLLPLPARKGLRGFRAEVRTLRKEGFDAVVLFPNSVSSALSATFAGIGVRVGYTRGRRLWITHGLRAKTRKRRRIGGRGPRREPIPMIDYWFALLDALGMPEVEPKPILRVTGEEEEAAREKLGELGLAPRGRLLLLNPGAAFGPTKLWSPERWAALGAALASDLGEGDLVLILTGPGEDRLAEAILRDLPPGLPIRAALDPPIPLGPLKAVVRRAELMVTTDSGPRHIAVAFDVPHVVLMGPTHPGYTARNLEFATVLRKEVDCGPCHLQTCPLDHRCMEGLETAEVLAACRETLTRRSRAGT